MAGEAFQFPENVGADALAGFQDEATRMRDFVEAGSGLQQGVNVPVQSRRTVEQENEEFQTAMMGVAHQGGAQHDLNPRGFSSDDTIERSLQYEQTGWNDLGNQVETVRGYPQGNSQDYQQLYGQSENEKGELRRALQAQMEANQRLMEQMQMAQFQAQTPPPNFFGEAPAQNVNTWVGNGYQPQTAQYTAAPQVPQVNPGYRFVQKDDNEMVLAGEVNEAIRREVAPYVIDAYNRAAAAEQSVQVAHKRLFESQKVQMGITPQVEQLALTQQPWIRNIQDPQAYLGALFSFKEQVERANLMRRTTPQLPQGGASQGNVQRTAVAPQGQRLIRRTTFIEGPGQRVAGEAGADANSANAQWEAAWAATMDLPFDRRADAQGKLLKARGISSVSGYRDPMTLSR